LEARIARADKNDHVPDPPRYPGVPRWVKTFGIVAGLLILLLIILLHAGGGPRHDNQSSDAGGGQMLFEADRR